MMMLIQGFDDVWLPDGDQLLPEETQMEYDQVQEDRVHPQGLEPRNTVCSEKDQVTKCLVGSIETITIYSKSIS